MPNPRRPIPKSKVQLTSSPEPQSPTPTPPPDPTPLPEAGLVEQLVKLSVANRRGTLAAAGSVPQPSETPEPPEPAPGQPAWTDADPDVGVEVPDDEFGSALKQLLLKAVAPKPAVDLTATTILPQDARTLSGTLKMVKDELYRSDPLKPFRLLLGSSRLLPWSSIPEPMRQNLLEGVKTRLQDEEFLMSMVGVFLALNGPMSPHRMADVLKIGTAFQELMSLASMVELPSPEPSVN